MSVPEAILQEAARVQLALCTADVVELAALRGRAAELAQRAAARALALPALGRVRMSPSRLVLSVRPERWLIVGPVASPGASAALWQAAGADAGVAVDLSSALAALQLAGPAAGELLSRGCRLDLDPRVFAVGSAAATQVAQVAVILARLPSGMLLLTPATTAQHLREWLAAAGQPFGLALRADVTVAALCGDEAV